MKIRVLLLLILLLFGKFRNFRVKRTLSDHLPIRYRVLMTAFELYPTASPSMLDITAILLDDVSVFNRKNTI